MPRIAVLDDYQNVALDLADWSGLDVKVFSEPLDDLDRLIPFDILCVMRERTPFPRGLFERLPNLKLLVTTGKANAAIDLEAARDHGVVVSATGSPGHATAELTWGLILSLARNIPAEERNMRAGRWQTTLGTDLCGKTLGVIGLGRLGSQVARIGAAFGMEVVAWSRNLTDRRASECGAVRVGREALFRDADVISIHMKNSGEIRHLVGPEELARMKPTAFLVNTSRGPIIDTGALVEALQENRIGGAALDVYDAEPLPADHPLRSCPNCVLTPHIGYVTRETYEVFYGETVEAVRAFLSGQPVRVLI